LPKRKQNDNEDNKLRNSLASLLLDIPHFEMEGNQEIRIEGCRGVLEYDNQIIRINTNTMVVSFKGRGLNLKCLSPTSLVIEGCILHIEFVL